MQRHVNMYWESQVWLPMSLILTNLSPRPGWSPCTKTKITEINAAKHRTHKKSYLEPRWTPPYHWKSVREEPYHTGRNSYASSNTCSHMHDVCKVAYNMCPLLMGCSKFLTQSRIWLSRCVSVCRLQELATPVFLCRIFSNSTWLYISFRSILK